jgi:tRNA nucleotidyltransferase (CCA-adding enzyme)
MSGSAAVVVRRTGYPQVDPRAAGLMHRALLVVSPRLPVSLALRIAERRRARDVAARIGSTWGVVSRETLSRALALGLGQAPLAAVLWNAPLVRAATPEITVRRRLGPDCPAVLVGGPRGPEGVVRREPRAPEGLPLSVARELDRVPGRGGEILRTAGALGDALGLPVAAVGGLVRDLLLGCAHEQTDLDLVVEGGAAVLANRLAAGLGGRVVEHPAFLTATVVLPDGRRLDLATARSETYRTPGALPDVEPASIAEDLARRDFSLNALAIRLDRAAWGRLVDTTGGLVDLRARRIRVLQPLSFVEDPTRIFRAARLAARLGCWIDRTTRRLAVHAAGLGVYPSLSGDRLRGELELMLAERRPVAALRQATELGAWALVAGLRAPGRRASRLLAAALAPRSLEGLSPDAPLALALLCLAEGTTSIEPWMDGLALGPTLRAAIRHARREAPSLLARLSRTRRQATAYAILQGVPELTAAWARALAGGRARGQVDRHLRTWRRLTPLATGDDIAALGVPPGPVIGELLRGLRAEQAAGRVRTRAGAIRWLTGAVARGRARRKAPLTRPGKGGG